MLGLQTFQVLAPPPVLAVISNRLTLAIPRRWHQANRCDRCILSHRIIRSIAVTDRGISRQHIVDIHRQRCCIDIGTISRLNGQCVHRCRCIFQRLSTIVTTLMAKIGETVLVNNLRRSRNALIKCHNLIRQTLGHIAIISGYCLDHPLMSP